MPNDLIVGLAEAPANLDPHASNSLHIHAVLWPVYEPLFDIAHDGGPVPSLAGGWTVDAPNYTFHLRQGARLYPSGDDLTSHHVERGLRRAMSGPSSRAQILSGLIKNITPESQKDVTVELWYPKSELLFLALIAVEKEGGNLEGTGPFYLVGSQEPRQAKYSLLPSHNPRLKTLTFQVPTGNLKSALLKGEIHVARDVSPDDVPEILDTPGFSVRQTRPHGVHYLGFNLDSKLWGDLKVRQAVYLAIDFRKIAADTGLEPAMGPLPPQVEAYDPTFGGPAVPRHFVRPSRIRSGCKVPLLYNQHSYYGDGLASRVAEDLAKVGIEVVREPCESSDELVRVLKERRHREEDPYLFIYNWYSILPAAEIFLRPLFEDSWDDNLTGYCDATAELQRLRDPNLTASQRIAAYRAAQQKIVNDLPLICLGHPRVRFSAYNSRVSGLGLNVQSFPVDRFFGVDVS